MPQTVALIAHDGKKDDMVRLAIAQREPTRTVPLDRYRHDGRTRCAHDQFGDRTDVERPNGR